MRCDSILMRLVALRFDMFRYVTWDNVTSHHLAVRFTPLQRVKHNRACNVYLFAALKSMTEESWNCLMCKISINIATKIDHQLFRKCRFFNFSAFEISTVQNILPQPPRIF